MSKLLLQVATFASLFLDVYSAPTNVAGVEVAGLSPDLPPYEIFIEGPSDSLTLESTGISPAQLYNMSLELVNNPELFASELEARDFGPLEKRYTDRCLSPDNPSDPWSQTDP
ncbi:unnamed protein product [Parascedosporium putredinis]|uniref:Uncharacterized protein n=1 Tax=Parascedosporium putredinis TaxID=1442378 RepID=A0A9P1H238_9PEZI|nr:unnamed protein product [Parascedosporium putredinis]CAI7994369.1 unnamed protein product [Parascedosporium putredinis]